MLFHQFKFFDSVEYIGDLFSSLLLFLLFHQFKYFDLFEYIGDFSFSFFVSFIFFFFWVTIHFRDFYGLFSLNSTRYNRLLVFFPLASVVVRFGADWAESSYWPYRQSFEAF